MQVRSGSFDIYGVVDPISRSNLVALKEYRRKILRYEKNIDILDPHRRAQPQGLQSQPMFLWRQDPLLLPFPPWYCHHP